VRRDTACIGLVLLALSGGRATASHEQVRIQEIARLDDPQALADLCRDPSWAIRRAAVARVPAGPLVLELARHDPDPYVREEAVGRLEDEDVLTRIVLEDDSRRVRFRALSRLDAPERFVEVALKDRRGDMAPLAVPQIRNPELLLRVVREAPQRGTRELAVARLAALDPPRLATLATEEKDVALRRMAASQVTDPALLGRLAKRTPTRGAPGGGGQLGSSSPGRDRGGQTRPRARGGRLPAHGSRGPARAQPGPRRRCLAAGRPRRRGARRRGARRPTCASAPAPPPS
jgi:hypothetical protein